MATWRQKPGTVGRPVPLAELPELVLLHIGGDSIDFVEPGDFRGRVYTAFPMTGRFDWVAYEAELRDDHAPPPDLSESLE